VAPDSSSSVVSYKPLTAGDFATLHSSMPEASDSPILDQYVPSPIFRKITGPSDVPVWNPSLVTLFTSLDSKSNWDPNQPTSYDAFLISLIQSIFMPILSQYQKDPQQLNYALVIFNSLVEQICHGAHLAPNVLLDQIDFTSYRDLLSGYTNPPVPDQPLMPVERMHLDRLQLNSVDPVNFVDKSVQDAAIDLWNKEPPPVFGSKVDSIKLARQNLERKTREWSQFEYDHFLIAPPREPLSENGDLPLELQWELPTTFHESDEEDVLHKLIPYDDEAATPPQNAKEIISRFQQGLSLFVSKMESFPFPAEAGMLGAEQVNFIPPSNILFPALDAQDHLVREPSGSFLNQWGLDAIQSRGTENNQQALQTVGKQFAESKAWSDFGEAFNKKWEEISDQFRQYYPKSPAWQKQLEAWKQQYDVDPNTIATELKEFMDSTLYSLRMKFYDPWVVGITGVVMQDMPIPSFFYAVQSHLVILQQEGQKRGGLNDVVFLISLMLQGIKEVLEAHQQSVLDEAKHLSENPMASALAEQIPTSYQETLWYFDVMSRSYQRYAETLGLDLPSLPDSDQPLPSPFVANTLKEAKEFSAVLDRAQSFLPASTTDLKTSFQNWAAHETAYKKVKIILKKSGDQNLFSDSLISFLEKDTNAQEFYDSVHSQVNETTDLFNQICSPLIANEPQLTKEVMTYLSPRDAEDFINRLRYALYLYMYFIDLTGTYLERNRGNLDTLVKSDLGRWMKGLTLRWPLPDGCTEKLYEEADSPDSICPNGGFKADFTFNPNQKYYLTQDDVLALLDPQSKVSEEETVTRLIHFFGNYDEGYYKFFTYGGSEENVQGEQIGYVRDHVALNQFLLVLQDIYQAAQGKVITAEDEKEKEYAGKMARIAEQLAYHLESLLDSADAHNPFYAQMDEHLNYFNIIPQEEVHSFTPQLDHGDLQDQLALKIHSILWKAEHQYADLLRPLESQFKLAEIIAHRASSEDDMPSAKLILLEQSLKMFPSPDPFTPVDWYLRKAYSPETKYLLGRLMERAQDKPVIPARERAHKIKTILESTSLDLLKEVPLFIQDGDISDDFLIRQGFPETTAALLVSLSPEEKLWVSGYLGSRLAVSERYYKDDRTNDVYFEEMRQINLDDFLFALTPEQAREEIEKITKTCNLSADTFLKYSTDDEKIKETIKELDDYFKDSVLLEARKNADSLYIKLNTNYDFDSFDSVELLFIAALLAHDITQTPSTDDCDRLGTDLNSNYSSDFDRSKIDAFYAQIPPSEKPILYRFVYTLLFSDDYRSSLADHIEGIKGTSSALLSEEGLNGTGNQFWKWIEPKLLSDSNSKKETPLFGKQEYDEALKAHIAWSWEKNHIDPPLMNTDKTSKTAFVALLNKVLTDPHFYKKNKKKFDSLISALEKKSPDAAHHFKERLATYAQLSPENMKNLNLNLMGLIDPLLLPKTRERMALTLEMDDLLKKDFGDHGKRGDMVLDIPTQLVLEEVFRETREAYGDQGHADTAQALKEILLDPYNDKDPIENRLYSRYNPNRYSRDRGPPADLTLIYSRKYFSAQNRIDNPYLLDDVKNILLDMLKMVEGTIPESQMEEVVRTRWNQRKALIAIKESHYFEAYLEPDTLAFYRYHNYEEVPEVEKRLKKMDQLLDLRIAELKE